ncbi:MAG: substrate-binding domain-containing protein [Lachnospiraceae bacterium]|nr:substrate-binding domain-containing protein [Lachnospiraceae bacterium]
MQNEEMEVEVKKVTLKDVAQASGYSLVSVHRAMNNKEGVSKAVRQEILKVASDMGYTANYVAAALKRRQFNLAVVLPEPDEAGKYYFRYFWKGCKDYEASVAGYNMNVMNYTFCVDGSKGEEEQVEILKHLYEEWGGKLDGLLTAPNANSFEMQRLLSQFTAKGVSVVLIDNDLKDCGRLCCIAPNDIYTGQLSAELMEMVLRGQKGTILVAAGDARSWSHQMNASGFEDYLKQHNSDIQVLSVQDQNDPEANSRQIQELFTQREDIIGAYSVRARNTIPLCQAAIRSGKLERLFLVGSDLFPESAQMLKDGVLKAIVYKNPYEKGFQGYRALFEYLLKGTVPKDEAISVQISIILQSNLNFFKEYI